MGESRALILSLATPSGSLQEFTEVNRSSWRSFNLKLFGSTGSLLLQAGFLKLQRGGILSSCSVQASHCGVFSCYRAQALGSWGGASVVAGPRL